MLCVMCEKAIKDDSGFCADCRIEIEVLTLPKSVEQIKEQSKEGENDDYREDK